MEGIYSSEEFGSSLDAIVYDREGGFMTYRLFSARYLNQKTGFYATQLVVTPWSPEEDGERLSEIIEQLTERVRNKRLAQQQAPTPVNVKKTLFTRVEETNFVDLIHDEDTYGDPQQGATDTRSMQCIEADTYKRCVCKKECANCRVLLDHPKGWSSVTGTVYIV